MGTLVIFLLLISINGEKAAVGQDVSPAIMRHPIHDVVIVCDEPVHNFGTVWAGDELRHIFEIRNDGADWAYLRFSLPPVGSWSFAIGPHETVLLPISLNSEKFRNSFAKHVTLTFIDDMAEMKCSTCGSMMCSEGHIRQCGHLCHPPTPDKSFVTRGAAHKWDDLDFSIMRMLLTAGSYKPPEAQPGPLRHPLHDVVIVCDEPVHDFGTVWAGDELRHVFEIRNDGADGAFLRLSYPPVTSCNFFIEAHQSLFVPVMLRSEKLRGKFNKHVNLAFIDDVADLGCDECGQWMGSEEHVQQCGAVCLKPMVSQGCVHLKPPVWPISP